MDTFRALAQLIVSVSVLYTWVFRFENIVREFKQYGLSTLTRTIVGATKIALATLLLAGLWYPALVLVPALLMAGLLMAAQQFHFKAKHPWSQRLPSLVLLLLCVLIIALSLQDRLQ